MPCGIFILKHLLPRRELGQDIFHSFPILRCSEHKEIVCFKDIHTTVWVIQACCLDSAHVEAHMISTQ